MPLGPSLPRRAKRQARGFSPRFEESSSSEFDRGEFHFYLNRGILSFIQFVLVREHCWVCAWTLIGSAPWSVTAFHPPTCPTLLSFTRHTSAIFPVFPSFTSIPL